MRLLLAGLLLATGVPQEYPRLSGPVTDLTGTLSASERGEVERISRALEASDSTQIALLVIPTTGGRPIEDYALETARRNGIGQAGKNNGVLIVVALQDRKCRIEVGTGLEGKLPDGLAGEIIRREMIPEFKQRRFGRGCVGAVRAVSMSVKGEYQAEVARRDKRAATMTGVIMSIFILIVIISMFRNRRGYGRRGWGYSPLFIGGGGWGGRGGGGGGWSGGGGGFSGGGASGGW